jgi:hypothetical protein
MIKACYLHNHMHPTFPTLHCMISHSSLVIPNIWWIIGTDSDIRLCVTRFSFFNNYLFQKGGRIHYLVSIAMLVINCNFHSSLLKSYKYEKFPILVFYVLAIYTNLNRIKKWLKDKVIKIFKATIREKK